ncbi:MAG: DUF3352 domain-containing protein, partial [Planctomycetales bacterium]|nr:DUF3352 domain-containing protein [Planctomycetales bacterium]
MVGSRARKCFAHVATAATIAVLLTVASPVGRAQDAAAADRPVCEQVLPATTCAFAATSDTADLFERWDRSRIGQLLNGELMSPFIDEVYQRLQTVWLEGHQRLGIEWADVRDVPTGQVAVGYVDEPDQRPAIVLWMDVKGNVKAAEDLLKKVQTNLIDQGAQREEIESKGVKIVVYTVPPREGLRRNDKAVHFIKDDVLIVAGGVMLAEKLHDRWDGSAADSIAEREPFQAVMNRCSQAVGDAKPAVRWFVDPYPLADALEETAPPKPA